MAFLFSPNIANH